MVRALPTIHINGATYFIDEQFREFRRIGDPQDAVRFAREDTFRLFVQRAIQPQTPRLPYPAELSALAAFWREHGNEEAVYDAFIAVFDDYSTDCPGYQGKVMTVVWGGDPSFNDVYIWIDGRLKGVDRDRCILAPTQSRYDSPVAAVR